MPIKLQGMHYLLYSILPPPNHEQGMYTPICCLPNHLGLQAADGKGLVINQGDLFLLFHLMQEVQQQGLPMHTKKSSAHCKIFEDDWDALENGESS
jgi:hypothetical protein